MIWDLVGSMAAALLEAATADWTKVRYQLLDFAKQNVGRLLQMMTGTFL